MNTIVPAAVHGEGLVLVDDLEVVEDVGVVQLVVDALVEGQGLSSPPLVSVSVHGRVCKTEDSTHSIKSQG